MLLLTDGNTLDPVIPPTYALSVTSTNTFLSDYHFICFTLYSPPPLPPTAYSWKALPSTLLNWHLLSHCPRNHFKHKSDTIHEALLYRYLLHPTLHVHRYNYFCGLYFYATLTCIFNLTFFWNLPQRPISLLPFYPNPFHL